ncbi:thiamine pyrophosphate-dependent enzyme [Candidatus Desulforudis audaxviator]|uniref:thiamine pyrophosphate-dependent enzyme n=1 Tax=Candidatus Desulforudis audaxviator TaxID=471827 RepID=UPI0005A2A0EF|nr:thiamine pyrophosphate-dependent enzyme [Candidatus Desulforudis audaxviator]
MKKIFERPQALTDKPLHYCPGCTHGIIHRLVAQAIDQLGVRTRTIGVCPVGCAVFAYEYFNCDMVQAAHGRAAAVATGVKRVHPDRVVFTYQGDGDLAAIGMAETIHAAARGEKFTTIFVNNAIYGMTGGQMAPTTLVGQKTTTTPFGRDVENTGMPIKVSELLSTIDRAVYIARVSVHNPRHVIQAGRAIRKAFEFQLRGLGFTMVEVLSTCPTNWGLSPLEALTWLEEHMLPVYPLGEFRKPAEEEAV